MDALSVVLRSLRLRSAVLSLARMTGRWGVMTQGMPRTMIFHGIVAGRCVLRRESGGPELELGAGDVAFIARGDAHRLTSEAGVAPLPIGQVPSRMAGAVSVLTYGTPGDETRIVCGTCTLDHPAAASLVELLPGVMVWRPKEEARKNWTMATLALLELEVQDPARSSHVVSLTDAIFVHLVAESAAAEGAPAAGLLAATRDAHIGRALALIHSDPAKGWTAGELSEHAGLSRTRFFELFSSLVGEPPAKYVARWRVLAAADLLRQKNLSTEEVAERVGYSSEDALARAFKRHMGVSVGDYKRAGDDAN